MKALGHLTSVMALALDKSRMTDAGLAELKDFKRLTSLRLDETPITDQGLRELKRHKNLSRLTVLDTKVTKQGVKELQKALPDLFIHAGRSGR